MCDLWADDDVHWEQTPCTLTLYPPGGCDSCTFLCGTLGITFWSLWLPTLVISQEVAMVLSCVTNGNHITFHGNLYLIMSCLKVVCPLSQQKCLAAMETSKYGGYCYQDWTVQSVPMPMLLCGIRKWAVRLQTCGLLDCRLCMFGSDGHPEWDMRPNVKVNLSKSAPSLEIHQLDTYSPGQWNSRFSVHHEHYLSIISKSS